MSKLVLEIWRYLTEPRTPDIGKARQEQMARLIFVLMGGALIIFALVVTASSYFTGLDGFAILIMLALLLLTILGWLLVHHGRVGLGKLIPPTIFFLLGLYSSFENGLVTTGLLYYTLSILLTSILFSVNAQWVMVFLSLLAHLCVGWFWVDRSIELLIVVAVAATGSFVGISLLLWYYAHQLQSAIDQSTKNAQDLEQKKNDLYLTNQQLQLEVDKHNRAKEALISTNRLLESIYDTIPDPIIWTDPDGIIVSCNEQVQRVFGYSHQELIGQNINILFHQKDERKNDLQKTKSVLDKQGYLEQVILTLANKDGRVFRSNVSVGQLKDDGGLIFGYVGSLRDISEQIQAKEEISRRSAQLEALRKTGLELAAQLDLEDLFHAIVMRAIELMNADAGGIYLYRPEIDLLERSFSIGDCVPPVGAKRQRGEGFSGTVWQRGESMHVADYRTWEGRIYDNRQVIPQGVVGTPIQWGDEFLGVLVVSILPSSDRSFLPVDVETLGLFSTQVAIAINNARLYQSVDRKASHLALVNRIAAGSTLDLDDLLYVVYQELSQIFTTDAFFAALYHDEKCELDFRLAIENGNQIFLGVQPVGVGLTSLVINRGEPLLIRDLENESEFRSIVIIDGALTPASWLATPIKIGKRVLGVLNVQSKNPFAYDDEDMLLFSTIADQIAIAIENARLYEKTDQLLIFNENIVRGIQEGIVISDSDGVFTFLNPAAATILDYEINDLLGRSWMSIIHSNNTASLGTIFDRMEQGETVRYEFKLARRNGEYLNAIINSRPLFNKDSGEFEGALSSFIDISSRVKAEKQRDKTFQELQHRLAFEKIISNISSQFVRSDDLDTTINETLEATGKITGADRAYLFQFNTDEQVLDYTHGWYSDGIPSQIKFPHNLLLTDYQWGFDRLFSNNGLIVEDVSLLPVEAKAEKGFMERHDIASILALPVHAGAKPIGVIGFNHTLRYVWNEENVALLRMVSELIGTALERNKVEKEKNSLLAKIQQQANQITQTIEAVPEGVLLLDPFLRIMIENPTAREFLAIMNGSDTDFASHSGDRTLLRLGDLEIMELLNPVKGDWHEVTIKDFTFEVFSRPISQSSESGGWVLVMRDVTQERLVQERIQQQDRLAAVGQLAAGIAHDFNNIMAVILLYAQLSLHEKNLPARVGERLGIIVEQSQRAADLINQILDFSRRAILIKEPIDLAPLLKEQVKLLERTLPETIDVELFLDDGQFYVNADLTRIQQILLNLAVNARDAMPVGGKLSFSLSRVLAGEHITCHTCGLVIMGEWVKLTISDTGTGIPDTVLPHIFDPFFTTKEPGKGSGLGLAQIYGIVKQHDGHISLSTEYGCGTEFRVYLPAYYNRKIETQEKSTTLLPTGNGQTILVVEDEAVVRQVLVLGLGTLFYNTLEANNGYEALKILKEHHDEISLIMSDVVMPEMGGIQLARMVRKLYPRMGIILLTGYPREKDSAELESAGVRTVLGKPVNLDELAWAISEALI